MDGLHICLLVLLGVVCCSDGQISGSVLEVTVRAGDNITLHCDCKLSTGVYILWYRNCSHENQPALVFRTKLGSGKGTNDPFRIFPRFKFVRNFSSESYDLLIENITDVDEGLYYCGTEHRKVEDQNCITIRHDYRYGNVTTRIIFNSSSQPDSSQCISVHVGSWTMASIPAFTILFSFLSFILVYCLCQKTDKEAEILLKRPDTRGQTRWIQDEELCLTQVVFRAKDGQTHQQAEDGAHKVETK
ncbi:uncharacterized protein LOC121604661 [Chelmon rostratus]|uniref:uncharacterized protein LOC121604661 n=1 Tax=Chelmon rostratus TaxID=109905 RepID=UPI001BE593B5|nr:uncharacterized protein LOC121604661 [Chelmon rostratus]